MDGISRFNDIIIYLRSGSGAVAAANTTIGETGNTVQGPNLTRDKETGIGSFTKEDFEGR